MLKTAQRLNLILTMNNYCMDLGLLKDYQPEALLDFCGSLEERQTPRPWYTGYLAIQKELINNERFFFYLEKLSKTGIAMRTIDSFLAVLHSNGETSLDYPINRLLSSMAMTVYSSDVFHDYLKYFSTISTSRAQKETIVKNLQLHRKQLSKSVAELSEIERLLFLQPCLANKYIIPQNIGRTLAMLAHQDGLLNIINFFHDNNFYFSLKIEHYESFCLSPFAIYNKLKQLHKQLGHANTNRLLRRWVENNCPLYDLEALREKLRGMDDERVEDVLSTHSSYINLIYTGRISNIPLTEVPKQKEDILIYAITARKTGFIRLVEENFKIFSSLPYESILFRREFYARHVNLNTLNVNNLRDCGRMMVRNMEFDSLDFDRAYTFEEIKALHNQPVQYLKLYTKLGIPRVDGRLIVLKQLTKHNLLANLTSDEHIGQLADKLSQKPLSAWRDQDFSHIDGLKPQDAVELLIRQSETAKLIPQMKTRIDARLALRNWNNVQGYNTIDDMKRDLMKIDGAWVELVGKMGFSEQFLELNQERVLEFLCQNGADIANTYYENLDNKRRESMRRIVKAVLMGEFGRLKYHADDLRLEIDYTISDKQKSVWTENTELTAGTFTVREHDDFFGTMLLGIMPQRTCLSYIDGQYSECLLSNFDSNKKVLYAELDGKVVGRAIIRLTKGRFKGVGKQPESDSSPSLSFVDLEMPETKADESDDDAKKERLVLFLERSYSSTITEEVHRQVNKLFTELMEQKSIRMGVMLVLSNSYDGSLRPGYTRTLFHIYISKSKAGTQYLDSLNGSAVKSDEGGYRVNNFYIRNDDVTDGTEGTVSYQE